MWIGKNRDGFRRCSSCKEEKELISENFCKDKNRASGLSYRCRICDSSKKDLRKHRYKQMSDKDKDKKRESDRKYKSQGIGRAVDLVCSYRKIDKKRIKYAI